MDKKDRRVDSPKGNKKSLLVVLSMILLVAFVLATAPSTPPTVSPDDGIIYFSSNDIKISCSGSTDADGSPFNYSFYDNIQIEDVLDINHPVTENGSGTREISDVSTNFINCRTQNNGWCKANFNATVYDNNWSLEMYIDIQIQAVKIEINGTDVYSFAGGAVGTGKYNLTFDTSNYTGKRITFSLQSQRSGDVQWRSTSWNWTKPLANDTLRLSLNNSNTSYSLNNLQIDRNYQWGCRACDKDQNCSNFIDNRTINFGNFTGCSDEQTELNITFINESNLQAIDGQIDSLSMLFDSGDVGDYTFTNSTTTNQASFGFCISPTDVNINQSGTITYDGLSFIERTLTFSDEIKEGYQINKTLYLLPLVDGQYVTFQVIDVGGSPISGVTVTATKVIGGNTHTVSSGTTDASGGVTFWLDPLSAHTITATKSGVGTVSTSITPSQSSYTITLGTTSTTNTTNYFEGITYSYLPTDIILNNDTLYNFTYHINSSYWNLTSYGFGLYNSTGLVQAVQTNTPATGGTVTIEFNTTGQTELTMWYWWNVGGEITNQSKAWNVRNTYVGDLSIKNFLNDFTAYADVGFGAGFDSFGKVLLSIAILLIVTGSLCFGFGIYAPFGISTIVLFTTWGLEATNLMPPLIRKYLLTALVGMIWVTFLIQEMSK